MHRIVTKDKVVPMRRRRTENEFGIGDRLEFHRFVRRFESREIPMLQLVRNRHGARCNGGPQDGVARRRLVAPALAGFQPHRQIIDRRSAVEPLGARARGYVGLITKARAGFDEKLAMAIGSFEEHESAS